MATTPERTSELGRRLREVREAKGMTRANLAFAADISEPSIARIELYGQQPKLDTIVRLAAALGVPVTDLLVAESTEAVS
jgi:XRE family transcriptional regulator, regulator of sulfur utilization